MDEINEGRSPDARTTRITIEDGERPSEVVVRGVASVRGREPTDIDPLYRSVDPDALDAFFTGRAPTAAGDRQVTFTFAGYHVTVTADAVVLEALDAIDAER